jgi:hypothetical protein
MSNTPQDLAKHVLGLKKKLGAEQIQWATEGTVIIDVGAPQMRTEHDGAIAYAGGRLHFFRKAVFGSTYESLHLFVVESAEPATMRFADGNVDAVLLNRNDGREPWAIVSDAEKLQFFSDKLAAVLPTSG